MPNKITHTQVYVLDQDEALDFYLGKLGFELNTDADLGFMRCVGRGAYAAFRSSSL
jgi:catechol 2,3-dioxygenase-like lactoylglutathione lyase family enzyme